MNGDATTGQLLLALGPLTGPRWRRRPPTGSHNSAPAGAAAEADQQLTFDLAGGPPADTPPFCRCCQRRGCLPLAGGGWTLCTWCEGTLVDPASLAVWLQRWRIARPLPALERLAS